MEEREKKKEKATKEERGEKEFSIYWAQESMRKMERKCNQGRVRKRDNLEKRVKDKQ